MFPHENSINSLKEIQVLEGSSKPKKVLDESTNKLYVLKTGFNKEHIDNEFQVNQAYRAFGCKVPQSKKYGDQILIEFIEGVGLKDYYTQNPNGVKQVCDKLKKHFVLDAWFANWDVIGLDDLNILVDNNGDPWRIDNGGALSYRAMGEKKQSGEWSEFVSEINTMNDRTFNEHTGRVFENISRQEMQEQVKEIRDKAETCIYPHLKNAHDIQTLKDRLLYLEQVFGRAETVTDHSAAISELMDMGFNYDLVCEALSLANGDVQSALNMLLN